MPNTTDMLKELLKADTPEAKKKMTMLFAGVLLAAFFLYFTFLLRPNLAKLGTLSREVGTLRKDIRDVNRDLELKPALQKKLEVLQAKMSEYENKLSRERELPMLLENISRLARECNVKILGIAPRSKTREAKSKAGGVGAHEEVPIVINAQSGYHELGTFVNKIETEERFMQISEIKIKSGKSNPRKHDIEFVVYAYTFKGTE